MHRMKPRQSRPIPKGGPMMPGIWLFVGVPVIVVVLMFLIIARSV